MTKTALARLESKPEKFVDSLLLREACKEVITADHKTLHSGW